MSDNKLSKKYIGTDQVGSSQLELENNSSLRSKDSAGNSQELLKLNSSGELEIQKQPKLPGDASSELQAIPKRQLDSAISGVEGQISDLDGRVDALEPKVSTLESEMDAVQSEISSLDGRVDALEPKVSTLESEMDAAQADIISLDGRVDALEPKVSTLESEMDAVQGDISTLNGVTEGLQSQVDQLFNEVADINVDIGTIDERLAVLEPKVSTLESEMDAAQGDILSLDGRVDTLESEVDALNGIIFQTQNVYIDPINGVDEAVAGRGSQLKPFATLGYAYSQLPSASSSYTTWAAQKIIFNLAPGSYSENVVLGFKRARIAIAGSGIIYTGTVTVRSVRSDYPGSGSTFNRALLPAPWTGSFPSPTFELMGVGAGTEGAFTADSMIFTQLIRFEQQSAGNINWQSVIGSHFICLSKVQLQNGLHVTHEDPGLGSTYVAEIDGCSISNGNIGVVPFASGGTLSSSMQLNIKAHSSQLNSTLGPRLTIQKIDACRIGNIDVTLGGVYSGNTNASIRTVDNNTTPGIVNSSFNGSLYNIGQAAGTGTITYKMDSNSYASLIEKTINNGSGTVAYNLIDKASGVAVSAAAPVNYSRSAANSQASFDGIDSALGQLVKLDGTRTMSGALNMGSFKITNLADPTNAQDAASKAYVDSKIDTKTDYEVQKVVLSASDISSQYVDLAFKAALGSVICSSQRVNLVATLDVDANADFRHDNSGSVTRLFFQGPSASAGESPLSENQIIYFNYVKA